MRIVRLAKFHLYQKLQKTTTVNAMYNTLEELPGFARVTNTSQTPPQSTPPPRKKSTQI
jgi:hypothetical protein